MNRAESERRLLHGAKAAREALAGRGYRVSEEAVRQGRVVFRCEGALGREALASIGVDAAGWTVSLSEFANGSRVSARTESSLGATDEDMRGLVADVIGEGRVAESLGGPPRYERPEPRPRRVDPKDATVGDLVRKFWRDDG